jgi:hypothetical protein
LNFALHLCPRLKNPSLLKKKRWETTQDTASKNEDSFEEIPQVSARQTSTEKNAAPPSHGSLSGKRKRLHDLSEAISAGLRQVNQTLLQVMEEDEFDAFGISMALGLKKKTAIKSSHTVST